MYNTPLSIGRAVTALGFALAAASLAHAQGGAPNAEGRTAEQVYRNIKVLKGTPASELIVSMHLINAATGLDCTYCHVEGAFDRDDKKPKETARQMMQMMIDLNKRSFGSRQRVTCYTCHRGHPQPLNMPVFPVANPEAPPAPALPTVDEILTRYADALGGQQAIRKIVSRTITGTQYIPAGPGGRIPVPATVERTQKAPNLFVNTYRTATYTIADGFDGTKAWSQDMTGRVTEPLDIDQRRATIDADFYLPLHLKQQYAKMEAQGIERVNDRDAYVLVGAPADGVPERFYFDTHTGLLLRKQTALPTPTGNSPFEVNHEDYRDTGGGAKLPYRITMYPITARTTLHTAATLQVTRVQDNAPIDNAKFAKPDPKAPARQ